MKLKPLLTQDERNLSDEQRLTRLETLMWVVLALSATSTMGFRVFDAISLFHP